MEVNDFTCTVACFMRLSWAAAAGRLDLVGSNQPIKESNNSLFPAGLRGRLSSSGVRPLFHDNKDFHVITLWCADCCLHMSDVYKYWRLLFASFFFFVLLSLVLCSCIIVLEVSSSDLFSLQEVIVVPEVKVSPRPYTPGSASVSSQSPPKMPLLLEKPCPSWWPVCSFAASS